MSWHLVVGMNFGREGYHVIARRRVKAAAGTRFTSEGEVVVVSIIDDILESFRRIPERLEQLEGKITNGDDDGDDV